LTRNNQNNGISEQRDILFVFFGHDKRPPSSDNQMINRKTGKKEAGYVGKTKREFAQR